MKNNTIGRRVTLLLLSLSTLLLAGTVAHALLPAEDAALRIEPQGDLASSWYVQAAGVEERINGTTGSLVVRNASERTLDDAVFYAEYVDFDGRECMSLAFSLQQNIGPSGPVAPGESRVLHASDSGLFPASDVSGVKIWLVREHAVGDSGRHQWDVPIRIPVTVDTGISANAARVQLSTIPESPDFADLLLARIHVNEQGAVTALQLLDVANNDAASWFQSFARSEMTFFPATDARGWHPGDVLVLVRLFFRQDLGTQRIQFSPRTSPWVSAYVKKSLESGLPPLTTVLLRRPPTKIRPMDSSEWIERPAAPQGAYEVFLVGSAWSVPAARMIGDPAAPNHMRTELVPSRIDEKSD